MATQVLDHLHMDRSRQETLRIAVTGSPGAGKSTFINALALHLAEQGSKVCILAVDPSSQETKGSILGDKTRMSDIVSHDNIYIRPSPAGETLGGVSSHTKETILLCEGAGFDITIIETVGVGQSEYYASQMADLTLLILQPGAGDDLQGIKRGIVEVADIFVVNKADSDHIDNAKRTQKYYRNALSLFYPRNPDFVTPVLRVSSLQKSGLGKVVEQVKKLVSIRKAKGSFSQRRQEQDVLWLQDRLKTKILQTFMEHGQIKEMIDDGFDKLKGDDISPYTIEQNIKQLLRTLLK